MSEKIQDIVAYLEKLASIPYRAGKLVAEALEVEIQSEFDKGVDPYGRPWAALSPETVRRHKRHPPPLTDTGAMRRTATVMPLSAGGVQIRVSQDYAEYHQYGTANMPEREILPTEGMPKAWDDAITDVINYLGKKNA